MAVWRVIMALIFPPFAVIDKGCGAFTLVFLLTLAGWIPGVIAALLIAYVDAQNGGERARSVDIPTRYVHVPVYDEDDEPAKRKGAFVRLEDGDVLEVIDDDERPLPPDEKRKRGAELI
ncbi:MAG: YqaE/Pmp3 family membrane protein [Chloroflexi bacterium]|nr:YqaE/Pmp3 family membrane protein [Chloroflexota bacterium]